MRRIKSGIKSHESRTRDSLFVICDSSRRGFALLFSVLATSVLLAISASIWNLALREVTLSSFGRESQVAFYTADSAIECALYWDFVGTAFATSSNSPLPPDIRCDASGVTATPSVVSGPLFATSTFSLSINTGCATVGVGKSNPTSGGTKINTHIESRGQNRCVVGDPTNVERGVRVKY